MSKILSIEKAIEISRKLKHQGKTVVLAGGCFDILHIGHIEFLKKAKEYGDFLFLLLESDETCQSKGKKRPINTQKDRAIILSALESVDYVIKLPPLRSDKDYQDLIISLKPDTIATTKGDLYKHIKERQAKLINAKVVEVIGKISNKSTTNLIKLLFEDYSL
ncbi:MAG: adenylyltransferase/cytidyltransferase family protein [Candidatus Levybacteria bacterium]|nr:adenylyltransferase/cytidyltransferase family protein [Candidatus Levybacteria bacterium]